MIVVFAPCATGWPFTDGLKDAWAELTWSGVIRAGGVDRDRSDMLHALEGPLHRLCPTSTHRLAVVGINTSSCHKEAAARSWRESCGGLSRGRISLIVELWSGKRR